MLKNFYITTTLPYVNARPHLGFALEIVQADAIARYRRYLGDVVFFNTGTDEHGLKIYEKVLQEKKKPQIYVDEYAVKFDNLKKALNLSYNSFIRTTDSKHIEAAKEFWKKCQEKGDIYLSKHKIKYCVGCEMEKTDSELVKGKCPLHPNKKLEIIEEENYFFRFSRYQKPLLNYYKKNPDFIIPEFRLKEIENFVKKGLKDFSISRLKKKMPWGIELPGDKNHIMYVWFDALINYISALGWPKKQNEFKKWWPGIQIAGKDNLRQQAAIWQAMLMSAGLPNSKQILIHGFITSGGRKMSKSLGNVIDPFALVEKYGTDAVRYYLLKEIKPTEDSDFSTQKFEELYNADLANGLGNLVQRLSKLCERIEFKGINLKLKLKSQKYRKYNRLFKAYKFNQCLEEIWQKISRLDRYINKFRLWEKKDKELKNLLLKPVREILEISFLLKPFLPETSEKTIKIFSRRKIKTPAKVLFPRIK